MLTWSEKKCFIIILFHFYMLTKYISADQYYSMKPRLGIFKLGPKSF